MKRILTILATSILIMTQVEAAELVPGYALDTSGVQSYDANDVAISVTYDNGITVRAKNDGTFKIMEVDYTGTGTGTEGAIVGETIDMEKFGAYDVSVSPYQNWVYYSFIKDELIVRIKADQNNTIYEVSHMINT